MYRIEIDDDNRDCERLTGRILEFADKHGLALRQPGVRDETRQTEVFEFVELDGFDRETFATKLHERYKSFKGNCYKTTHIKEGEKQMAATISQFKTEHVTGR